MRAIGYFRSRNDQASFGELEKAFSDYCGLYLHQAVSSFGDVDGTDGGPYVQYEALREYMRESGSNFLVVVPDASHLGNDLEGVARSLIELEGAGAKVTCADAEFPEPLQNALQTLSIKGVSRTRSTRIKESMLARAMSGKGLGRPPYGYRNGVDGSLEVVREESAVVELIFRLYTNDDMGLRLIVQHLNERGIPTKRGGNWNMVTIRDILRNPTYTGTYTRFGLRLPRSHEAIISPGVFRTAQDMTRSRRPVGRVTNAEPFLLSGHVYCGYCGNKMMGVTRRQTWKRKGGSRARGVYRYYQCQSRNNQSRCEYRTWRAHLLESTVFSQLRFALEARASDSDDGIPNDRKQEIRARWDTRVRNAERRFLQAVRRAAGGEMRIEVLSQYLRELDAARKDADDAGRLADVKATLAGWDSLPVAEVQRFLMERVSRITVKDDTVEVAV